MQNPPPPQAPTATPAPTPTVVIQGLPGAQPISLPIPRTVRDLDALRARREELSTQLNSVDGRRRKLMDQLRRTDDATATKGLQDRLSLLDARQLQLENDLAQTGQMLSSAAAGAIASTSAPRRIELQAGDGPVGAVYHLRSVSAGRWARTRDLPAHE